MEHQQQTGSAPQAPRPLRPNLERMRHVGPSSAPGVVARAAVSLGMRSLLAAGAVVAVGELLRHLTPGPALAVLVALATVALGALVRLLDRGRGPASLWGRTMLVHSWSMVRVLFTWCLPRTGSLGDVHMTGERRRKA